jgi:transposase
LAQDIGRSRGGRTSKIHAAVDQHGRPRHLIVTGGQVHDAKVLPAFLDWPDPPLAIVADKAYDSRAIRQAVTDEGALAVIPTRRTTRNTIPYDTTLYAQRNIVERFFCRMKDMRRLATRFEKLTRNFLAMIHIFAIRCWIN